jgi:hypothetical protein
MVLILFTRKKLSWPNQLLKAPSLNMRLSLNMTFQGDTYIQTISGNNNFPILLKQIQVGCMSLAEEF